MTIGIAASASAPGEGRRPSRAGGTVKPRGAPPGPAGERS